MRDGERERHGRVGRGTCGHGRGRERVHRGCRCGSGAGWESGRDAQGAPTQEGAWGECSRGARGAPDEHVHQAWRAYLNTPDEDSGSDSGLSHEDSNSGLLGLLSLATPTL